MVQAEIYNFARYYQYRHSSTPCGEKIHKINLWDKILALIPSKRLENIVDIKDFTEVVQTRFRARGTLRKIT